MLNTIDGEESQDSEAQAITDAMLKRYEDEVSIINERLELFHLSDVNLTGILWGH